MTRLEAIAFNALGDALRDVDRWMTLTERQKVASAVSAAVREEIAEQLLKYDPVEWALAGSDGGVVAVEIVRGERS